MFEIPNFYPPTRRKYAIVLVTNVGNSSHVLLRSELWTARQRHQRARRYVAVLCHDVRHARAPGQSGVRMHAQQQQMIKCRCASTKTIIDNVAVSMFLSVLRQKLFQRTPESGQASHALGLRSPPFLVEGGIDGHDVCPFLEEARQDRRAWRGTVAYAEAHDFLGSPFVIVTF